MAADARRRVGGLKQPAFATILIVVFWLGWGVLFLSTFLVNHFVLLGLTHVENA